MLFWIVAAVITVVALLLALAPLLRAAAGETTDDARDVAVYRQQLEEIDREREAGLIGQTEAQTARAEIGRRLIAAADRADALQAASGSGGRPRAIARMALLAGIVLVPAFTLGSYLVLGSPGFDAMPLAARNDREVANPEIAELIGKAEQHLAENPEDGRGWDVLAPIYLRLGRYGDSVIAWRNAIRLLGENETRLAGLGEAILAAASGIVTAEAEQAFDKALALRPDHPKALFFLGLARAQQNDVAAARQIWTKVAASGKDWAGAATSAIAELDQRNPQVATGGAAPKIDDETMAAAADMDKDAQRQMIDGMIARLDERLRGQPDDSEGWKRLIRAYVVLGDKAKAADALARAVGAFTVTDARRDEILAFARDLGVETQETTTQ